MQVLEEYSRISVKIRKELNNKMNQQDFDKAFKSLPDAGSYHHDIYLVPIINKRVTLVFKKRPFVIYGTELLVRWELETIE